MKVASKIYWLQLHSILSISRVALGRCKELKVETYGNLGSRECNMMHCVIVL